MLKFDAATRYSHRVMFPAPVALGGFRRHIFRVESHFPTLQFESAPFHLARLQLSGCPAPVAIAQVSTPHSRVACVRSLQYSVERHRQSCKICCMRMDSLLVIKPPAACLVLSIQTHDNINARYLDIHEIRTSPTSFANSSSFCLWSAHSDNQVYLAMMARTQNTCSIFHSLGKLLLRRLGEVGLPVLADTAEHNACKYSRRGFPSTRFFADGCLCIHHQGCSSFLLLGSNPEHPSAPVIRS